MNYQDPPTNTKKIITGIAVLAAIALLVVGAQLVAPKSPAELSNTTRQDTSIQKDPEPDTSASEAETKPAPDASTEKPSSAPQTVAYHNGTYSATGRYSTPGGIESIGLEITLTDDTVTATTLTQNPSNRDSRQYQAAFASGYKELIIGKKLDDISLSRVSGSSLTSQGFENALADIANQAKN